MSHFYGYCVYRTYIAKSLPLAIFVRHSRVHSIIVGYVCVQAETRKVVKRHCHCVSLFDKHTFIAGWQHGMSRRTHASVSRRCA